MVSKEYLNELERLEKEYARLEQDAKYAAYSLIGAAIVAPLVMVIGLLIISLF